METLWVWFVYGTIALPAIELALLLAWVAKGSRPPKAPLEHIPAPRFQILIQDFLIAAVAYAGAMMIINDASENALAGVRLLIGAWAVLDYLRFRPALQSPWARAAFLLASLALAACAPVVLLTAWYSWRRWRNGIALPPAKPESIVPRLMALTILLVYAVAFALPVEPSMPMRDGIYGYTAYGICLDELNSTLMRSLEGPFSSDGDILRPLCWLANPALWFGIRALMQGKLKRAIGLGLLAFGLSVTLRIAGSASVTPGYGMWIASMAAAAVAPAVLLVVDSLRSGKDPNLSSARIDHPV